MNGEVRFEIVERRRVLSSWECGLASSLVIAVGRFAVALMSGDEANK